MLTGFWKFRPVSVCQRADLTASKTIKIPTIRQLHPKDKCANLNLNRQVTKKTAGIKILAVFA